MSNEGFTLLWSKILDSSVWMQDGDTRLVWITLLAMRNSDGFVRSVPSNLAHRARVSEEACRKALAIFEAPDPESSNPKNEGRRIERRPGGWQILNHEEYRFSTEAKRQFWREQKAAQREAKAKEPERVRKKKQVMAGTGTLAERLAVQAEKDGDAETVERLKQMEAGRRNATEREFVEKFQREIAQAGEAERKESLVPGEVVEAGPPPGPEEGERFPEV